MIVSNRVAIVFMAVMVLAGISANSKTIRVSPAGEIQSIKAALNAVLSGDTIRVEAGSYHEHDLTINQSISLIGTDWPVVDAANQGPIFEITASGVSVSGFEFRGTPVSFVKEHAAILINNASRCDISDNRFRDNFFAIYLAKADHCRITRNDITGASTDLTTAGNGIHLWYCRDIDIRDNRIYGHRDGIYLEFVRHSFMSHNISERNLRYGLHFMFSDSCSYNGNQFLHNGSGVAVMYTNQVEMIDNRFSESWGGASYGLLLKDIKDSRIMGNRFSSNSIGIYMEGSDRVHIEKNRFTANGWAIKIMANCVESRIEQNDFIDNSFQVATNSRQTFSSFSGNYWSPYQGYDLNHDGLGDEPFRPVSLYSLLVESDPATLVLVRSLLVDLLNLAERIMPTLTPQALVDAEPSMRPVT